MNTGMVVAAAAGSYAINIGANSSGAYTWINSAFQNNSGTATPLAFMTGATERMRITSGGKLAIGSTGGGNGVLMQVDGSTATDTLTSFKDTRTDSYANAPIMYFQRTSGTVGSITTTTSTTAYNVTSDYRLKENVISIPTGLPTIMALNPVNFDWINDNRNDTGFIAHEIQAVIPNCVVGQKDAVDSKGNAIHQQLDTSGVIPFLVKAIQEQQVFIESLTTRLTALEAK
jgi:hypothetical protein